MAIEIERKFLVCDDRWRSQADKGSHYRQGYLSHDPRRCVRIRATDDRAWLNIKCATSPIRRLEYEYPVPLEDAQEMLNMLHNDDCVDKVRYRVRHGRHVWEVDVFEGANAGLVVAEIELDDEDEFFDRPEWLGREVSDDPRYYNMNLAKQPYTTW